MIVAPAPRAASIARPVKLMTSSVQPVPSSTGAAASRISRRRSSTVKSPTLFGLDPTPTTSRSHKALA